MKPKLVLLLSVALLLTLAGVALAQTSANYDLSWHVLSAGGREGMTSGSHTIHGTLSQLAIGPATSGQSSIGSGYWSGIQQSGGGPVPGPEGPEIYLPMVLKASP